MHKPAALKSFGLTLLISLLLALPVSGAQKATIIKIATVTILYPKTESYLNAYEVWHYKVHGVIGLVKSDFTTTFLLNDIFLVLLI